MADNNENGELPEMIRSIMDSPEVAGILQSVLKSGDDAPVEKASDAQEETEKPASGGMPSITPEMLQKLPAIMSMLSSMGIGAPSADDGADKAAPAGAMQNRKPALSGDRERKAFLKALRPYLNPRRQSVIDGMMQIGSLTEVFQGLHPKQ